MVGKKEPNTNATIRRKKSLEDDSNSIGTVDDVITLAPRGSGGMLGSLKWVFDHLPDISVETDTGEKRMNRKLLAEAPDDSARSFLLFAYEDTKRFVEKFAPRLLPKEEPKQAKTEEEREMLTDPSLTDLRDYLVVLEVAVEAGG